jgi:hypothetical protein
VIFETESRPNGLCGPYTERPLMLNCNHPTLSAVIQSLKTAPWPLVKSTSVLLDRPPEPIVDAH